MELVKATIPIESGLTHILFNLRAQGYKLIVVEYSGGGDDGAINDIAIYKEDGIISIPEDKMLAPQTDYSKSKELESELHDLIADKVYKMLERTSDWYNNDGGGGAFYIITDDAEYRIIHYQNIVRQEYEYYDGTLND